MACQIVDVQSDSTVQALAARPAPELRPRSEAIAVRVRFEGPDRVSLHLGGELDLATAPTLQPLAELLVSIGPSEILLDLTGISFVDVAGWRSLERFRQDLTTACVTVTTVASSPSLRRLATLLTRTTGATMVTVTG